MRLLLYTALAPYPVQCTHVHLRNRTKCLRCHFGNFLVDVGSHANTSGFLAFSRGSIVLPARLSSAFAFANGILKSTSEMTRL